MAIAAELLERERLGQDGTALLRHALRPCRRGEFAVMSSFGTESAVLLALVAEADPATPVLFLDTKQHFAETLRYRDTLAARFGLLDVRVVSPDPAAERAEDPDRMLWLHDEDACCRLRKVAPMDRALAGFGGWITGRKRHQAGTRAALPLVENRRGGRIVLNPLAGWDAARLSREARTRDLPSHPLADRGYTSIGCEVCTRRPTAGGDARSGRWSGSAKTECGIHRMPEPA